MTVGSSVSDAELKALARHYFGRGSAVSVERPGGGKVSVHVTRYRDGAVVGGGAIFGWESNAADWWRREMALAAR